MKTSLSSSLTSPSLQPHTLMQQLKTSDSALTNINFVTKEGDTVSIRSDVFNQSAQNASTYNNIQDSQLQKMSVDQFSINVVGDLNEEELADLANLLDKLETISDDFYSGNMEGAVSGALNIGEMGSIAKLEANFSHTTAIQGYLKGPHPMPDMQDMLFDEILASNQQASEPEHSITDALQAQWQQFLDYFNERSEKETMVADKNSQKTIGTDETATKMFDEARKTITKNPRLTPLIPSVADLAIDKSFSKFGNIPTNQEPQDIKDYFANEYSSWII